MQMMFQKSLAVIPPRMNLEAFLLEPLYQLWAYGCGVKAKDDIRKWMQRVDLPENTVYKYPPRSQRWSATTCRIGTDHVDEPKLVLFDEPTSALMR